MHYRFYAAVAFAIAGLSSSSAAEWTSFSIGQVTGFTTTYAPRPDGRFILGSSGSLFTQNTFGAAAKTQVAGGGLTFDPSFIAVKDDTTALLGAGGFGGPSGVHLFNPSAPATAISSTALASLQNYSAVYWKHPTSGREGWLIGGTNGTAYGSGPTAGNMHNVTFVSPDGTKVGAITGDLCTYSAGLAVDGAGQLYAAIFELSGSPNAADAEKVFKFTADQVDAAVAAVIAGSPSVVERSSAQLVFRFDGASSIAVDSLGRLWATSFNISYLQCYDPVTQLVRNFKPDHAPIVGAAGPTTYQVQTFSRSGAGYVSFLATDLFGTTGTNIIHGYKPVSELPVRIASFPTTALTKSEADGTATITVNLAPASTARVTVPFTLSGTATNRADYSIATSSVVFNPGETSKTITINLINDVIDEPNDNETVIVKLGTPTPGRDAGISATAGQFTLTITDNDLKPIITAVQGFGSLKVGSFFSHQVAITGGTATKYVAYGLPAGLTIHPTSGVISGRPVVPGEYAQVWIVATNAAGSSTSVAYILDVADFAAAAKGTFVGLADRAGTSTGELGARVDLMVSSAAMFSGKVTIGRNVFSISGPLDTSTSNPSGSAPFAGKTLAFSIDATTGALSGTITGGGVLTGWRGQNPSLLTGVHNFFAAVPGGPAAGVPQGTSYGSVNVLATGTAVVSGMTAEGLAFGSSAMISATGQVLVYQALYAVPGTFSGALGIANDSPRTLTGSLTWSKPSQLSGTTYRTGWTPVMNLAASGGRYRPVSGSTAILNVADTGLNNARMIFQDGGVEAFASNPTTGNFRLSAPALVSNALPHTLTITNSTGAFRGTAKLGTKAVAFQGMIVPDASSPDPFDGRGHGYFLLPTTTAGVTRSGMVIVEAIP